MKILSIGNSFSEDAHVYLRALAEQRSIDLETVNLAIGGCSLQAHWENIEKCNANYLHNVNGGEGWDKELVTIEEILKSEQFDAITLQQVSGFSGQYETYQPYLDNIISFVRKHQPNARLYLHRTWAYEIDSTHGDFPKYDCDQQKMYQSICKTTEKIANEIGATLIKSGDVIQALRENVSKFDYKNGGESLCRDGFHMSVTGRYAIALVWLATLTDKPVEPLPFGELDLETITEICTVVNKTVFNQ